MKNLTQITALTLSLIFSSTCFAEWTKVSKNMRGDTYYVDFDRIKQHGGYVYYWGLDDYLKPLTGGDLSSKLYIQGDCKMFRLKVLSLLFYKESMGQGTAYSMTPPDKWDYPSPGSSMEAELKHVCDFVKNR